MKSAWGNLFSFQTYNVRYWVGFKLGDTFALYGISYNHLRLIMITFDSIL